VRDAGIARVVAAVRDPDPRVDGRGLRLLRRAGLEVTSGVLTREAARLNARFLVSARAGRPFVLLKAALTLDGRIATASGDSRWITAPAERRQARWLRRLHDAVLIGVGTALADDPLLLPSPRTRRPFTRVVLDSRLRLPAASRLVRTASAGTPLVVISLSAPGSRRRGLERPGVTLLEVRAEGGRVSLPDALEALRARGIRSLMAEGGSEVLGAFLAGRLVDEVALFRAPLLLGGRGSLPAFGGPDPRQVSDALRLSPVPIDDPFPWPRPRLFELWYPD
jgi:diaminohydroxyphosphoribosylaminopyrimidine deaminase/5-amino-6-(5-phosphoribosylamino)uracil reductase